MHCVQIYNGFAYVVYRSMSRLVDFEELCVLNNWNTNFAQVKKLETKIPYINGIFMGWMRSK